MDIDTGDRSGDLCAPFKGCTEKGDCLPVCDLGLTNALDCLCAVKGETGQSCSGSTQGCDADGVCLDVCVSGMSHNDGCFCPTDDGGNTCPVSSGCVDGECLAVCVSDSYNEGACFCENKEDCSNGECSGAKCTEKLGCSSHGSCLPICPVRDKSEEDCFCRNGDLSDGNKCSSGQECQNSGVCKTVCESGETSSTSCFCEEGEDSEECSPGDGCLDGKCLAVCETDKLGSECFCADSGDSGDSCIGAFDSDGFSCFAVCTSGTTSEDSCFCEDYIEDTPQGTGSYCADGQGCVKGDCLKVCDANPEGDCICVSDQNEGGVKRGDGDSCDNGNCISSSQYLFSAHNNKCFLESSGVMINNVGKNRMNQNGQANWVVSSEGAKVSISTNTRPSVGTTDLGHKEGEDPLA